MHMTIRASIPQNIMFIYLYLTVIKAEAMAKGMETSTNDAIKR